MKYCSHCGNRLDDNQAMCQNCGTAVPTVSSVLEPPKYPMKWFKFLIYFALFFSAFYNVVFGLNYVTGGIYFVTTDGRVTAEMVYRTFGFVLKALDIVYGLLLFGLAVFTIIVRSSLAKFRANGPKNLYILYISGTALSLIYSILSGAIVGSSIINASTISSLICTAIFLGANYKYFSKRDRLFLH